MNSLFSHHQYDHRFRKLSFTKIGVPSFSAKLHKFCVIFLSLFFLATFSYFYAYCSEPGQFLYFKKQLIQPKGENPLKILLWTKNGDRSLFYGIDKLMTGECPVKCEVTDDLKLIDVADAVAFAGEQENGHHCQMPPQKKWNQIRVFFRMESPQTSEFRKLPNHYNWTMTYRRDSDVPIFYGGFRPKSSINVPTQEDFQKMASHSLPLSPAKLDQLKKLHLNSNKKKLIAWTVSHCRTTSEREKLAKKLAEYLPIDIYGGCGPLNCTKKRMDHDWNSCYQGLGREYKFYLSFENSLCWDYATEKLFESLDHGMVPIVYGGANYSEIAPPGSFIDVLSFESVEKLADHIKFLDEHPEEYVKYFLWRDKFKTDLSKDVYWWCQLCQKLWDHSVVVKSVEGDQGHWVNIIDPQYSKVNQDISRWWLTFSGNRSSSSSSGSPACRLAPKNFF